LEGLLFSYKEGLITMITVINRNQCRLCGSLDLEKFLTLESVPFFDEIIAADRIGKEFIYPMNLYFCNDCKSVQSLHDVDINEYYSSYQYAASNSMFIRRYMETLAKESFKRFEVKPGDAVIDIGAADGYMLSCFRDLGARVLGYEAAENLAGLAKNLDIPVLTKLFTAETIKEIPEDFRRVQVVILLHTFDHLTDPSPFLETVRRILDPQRGVLILEVHDLHDIVNKCEAALFGHEHATYLHVGSINRFLARKGFTLLDYNFVDKRLMRGSSMLIAAGLEGCNLSKKRALDLTAFDVFDRLSTLREFSLSVTRAYNNLRAYVNSERNKGRRLAGYGGWGRGVTTMAMAGLDKSYLEFVVDKNPKLHGCFTPVTHLKIMPPDVITRNRIDEIVVFNYAYLDEIKNAHQEFIAEGGVIKSVLEIMNTRKDL
jgi:SAM-dependent methyltransferase